MNGHELERLRVGEIVQYHRADPEDCTALIPVAGLIVHVNPDGRDGAVTLKLFHASGAEALVDAYGSATPAEGAFTRLGR